MKQLIKSFDVYKMDISSLYLLFSRRRKRNSDDDYFDHIFKSKRKLDDSDYITNTTIDSAAIASHRKRRESNKMWIVHLKITDGVMVMNIGMSNNLSFDFEFPGEHILLLVLIFQSSYEF